MPSNKKHKTWAYYEKRPGENPDYLRKQLFFYFEKLSESIGVIIDIDFKKPSVSFKIKDFSYEFERIKNETPKQFSDRVAKEIRSIKKYIK
jgi:hypothetical protein